MTLCTNIYVVGDLPIHDAFAKCRELLGTPADVPIIDEPSDWKGDDHWNLRHPGGVGLNAWLWCRYKPGGPLRTPEQVKQCDEDCDEDCDGSHPYRTACTYELSFDTAYGYKDAQGRGCGALHASYVAQLGEFLDEHGVRWGWQNEFTGEVHWGEDKYERLWDLFDGGDRAREWFTGVVKPLIERSIGSGGRVRWCE